MTYVPVPDTFLWDPFPEDPHPFPANPLRDRFYPGEDGGSDTKLTLKKAGQDRIEALERRVAELEALVAKLTEESK